MLTSGTKSELKCDAFCFLAIRFCFLFPLYIIKKEGKKLKGVYSTYKTLSFIGQEYDDRKK